MNLKRLTEWEKAVQKWERAPKRTRGKKPKKPKKPKTCRRASNVLSDTSKAYARKYIGKNLVLNPDTFCTNHAIQVLDHMFAGKHLHHQTCPHWCQRKENPNHLTILPRGQYYDRFGDEDHELAYDTIKPFLESRFSEENCKRLHGLPRTNGNEVRCFHLLLCFVTNTQSTCLVCAFHGLWASVQAHSTTETEYCERNSGQCCIYQESWDWDVLEGIFGESGISYWQVTV